MRIIDNDKCKILLSDEINHAFNKVTGDAMTWGKTTDDDPDSCPYGPLILDMEVSTMCSNGCSFCYKSNTCKGKNMSLETFKKIFDKLPKTVTQIAFGIGDIDANPDLWNIFAYCRERGVIPNVTINGSRMIKPCTRCEGSGEIKTWDKELGEQIEELCSDCEGEGEINYYDKLVKYCGAVAVSLYSYDVCYNAVQELSKRGLKQVNIHALLSTETYMRCVKVVDDKICDERLKGLNAIVFLWLKPKGERNTSTQLTDTQKFNDLINYAIKNHVKFGFDSCSAPKVMDIVKHDDTLKYMETMIEPCESTAFSYYINVDGLGFPCSFTEGVDGYNGINLLSINSFIDDVWNGVETLKFRDKLLCTKDCNGCRNCPIYNLGGPQ